MICELITVGTEIILGNIVDTHSQYMSDKLALYGVNVYHHVSVGDNRKRLNDTFENALKRSDMVILSGGLGPTTDDITLASVCEVLGLECYYNEEVLGEIRNHFERLNREMAQNNKKQAFVPKGCTIFMNHHGTAPGIKINHNGKIIIILPGPPRELRPMFVEYVEPFLEVITQKSLFSKTLRVYGIGESSVETKLLDIVTQTNPTVALYAKDVEVHIRVTQLVNKGDNDTKNTYDTVNAIKGILGDSVYSCDDESLENIVVAKLLEKNMKIAVAESCTGGMLASKITSVAGSSSVFDCGIISYSNQIKHDVLGVSQSSLDTFGAVSEQVAKEMAIGVLNLSKADIAVSITGIAGPDGGTQEKPVGTVYIGIATKGDVVASRYLFGYNRVNEREFIRLQSVMRALNEVRLRITQND